MGSDFYKVWGAALVAMTVALAIGIFINEATHAEHPEIKAYLIEVPDNGNQQVAAVPASPVIEPIAPLLAAADAALMELLAPGDPSRDEELVRILHRRLLRFSMITAGSDPTDENLLFYHLDPILS